MKRLLTFMMCFVCGRLSFAQDSLCQPSPLSNTQSYLMFDYAAKDTAFLKEQCRRAGLCIGIPVLANRIPVSSKLVAPTPSKHLLKQGALHLQLPMDEKQDEFAVYHSPLFDQPASINVLQIDEELITYRTVETSGNIHLLYQCTRGAFGTKRTAHSKDAIVYKLWDTPERSLLPDLELQDQMAQAEAKRLAETDVQLLIFNDLQSYAHGHGDTAIRHLLDTMKKYNPGKLLQADLLTPASRRSLNRVNENQSWNETMRTKITETLTEKQEFYRKNQMPWMIGNFQIRLADEYRKATTVEELEWFLSKAAAFDAGFGLDFNEETMRRHGLTDAMLRLINTWETLRQANAFSEEQKEAFKDPYENWHIEAGDSAYSLYPLHVSRQYFSRSGSERWQWSSPYKSYFALRIAVEGGGSFSELQVSTPKGTLTLPCTVKAGQYLIYNFDGTAFITDANFNPIEEVAAEGLSFLDEGVSEVSFACEVQPGKKKQPYINIRYYTRGIETTLAKPLLSPQMRMDEKEKYHK